MSEHREGERNNFECVGMSVPGMASAAPVVAPKNIASTKCSEETSAKIAN